MNKVYALQGLPATTALVDHWITIWLANHDRPYTDWSVIFTVELNYWSCLHHIAISYLGVNILSNGGYPPDFFFLFFYFFRCTIFLWLGPFFMLALAKWTLGQHMQIRESGDLQNDMVKNVLWGSPEQIQPLTITAQRLKVRMEAQRALAKWHRISPTLISIGEGLWINIEVLHIICDSTFLKDARHWCSFVKTCGLGPVPILGWWLNRLGLGLYAWRPSLSLTCLEQRLVSHK